MFYLLVVILGAIIGSFLNVVILRTHNGGDIIKSRSACPNCQHVLRPIDLVPLFSFIWQKGKCRYCHAKISWQYPLVESITALLFLVFFMVNMNRFGVPANFQASILNLPFILSVIRDWVFVCFLVVIFVYDLRWYLILDRITLPAMIIALILNLYLGFSWQSLMVGLVIGLGFFAFQFFISGGKWIGGGDLRMGALMGLMLGGKGVVVALFFSYIIGSVISVFLVIWGRKKFESQIPFGTFLAIGTVIALLWSDNIINWYISLF